MLGESHSSKYVVLLPDFKIGNLIQTKEFKEANILTSFGFSLAPIP